jgi:hypothetical protein
MITAQGQLLAFNSRPAPEAIKGNPRFVRLERSDDPNDPDRRHLQETAAYLADGRIAERTVYRPDGSVSYRFAYHYAAAGRLSTITTYDTTGKEVQRSSFSTSGDVQEEVLTTPAGTVSRGRTDEQRDSAGRVVASTQTDLSNNLRTRHMVHYDAAGQMIGEELEVQGSLPGIARVTAARRPDGHLVATVYAADGRIMAETEATDTGTRRECAQTLFAGDTTRRWTTVEEIVCTDEQGNWTEKTVTEHVGEPHSGDLTTVLYRTIAYH